MIFVLNGPRRDTGERVRERMARVCIAEGPV